MILRLTDPRLGSVITKKQGAIANYGYFDHTLTIIIKYNHPIAIFFTSWVLFDVPKIIFEVIGVIGRLTGPRLGSVILKKLGPTANFGTL